MLLPDESTTKSNIEHESDASINSNHKKNKPKKIRVTLLIPETLDKTIELCALIENCQKSDVVANFLTEGLVSKGYSPDKMPAAQIGLGVRLNPI